MKKAATLALQTRTCAPMQAHPGRRFAVEPCLRHHVASGV
eukprot:CAMPEP_0176123546 /NCGR_PEP_ID=MMETSP0120_2-20121206/62261_1 /TAXON_ID=160619 /ORGANISM="Kryptoperidinium foliaceum, Strain CCMP 1326" /LENGTH=39 /DNA_ID= /DNA_START= /DNA_END= /DNA_ORIENTATION=